MVLIRRYEVMYNYPAATPILSNPGPNISRITIWKSKVRSQYVNVFIMLILILMDGWVWSLHLWYCRHPASSMAERLTISTMSRIQENMPCLISIKFSLTTLTSYHSGVEREGSQHFEEQSNVWWSSNYFIIVPAQAQRSIHW